MSFKMHHSFIHSFEMEAIIQCSLIFPSWITFLCTVLFLRQSLEVISFQMGRKKNSLIQNTCHWSTLSLKEDIPDIFSKKALFKIKFYVGKRRGRLT